MPNSIFDASELIGRRSQVFDVVGPAHVLLQGAGPVRGFELPRQSNEFFYLCGVATPQAYLLMDGTSRTSSLYLPHRDPRGDDDGPTADEPELVREISGVENVYGLDLLTQHLSTAETLYVLKTPCEGKWESRDVVQHWMKSVDSDPWDNCLARETVFLETIRKRCPDVELRDLTPHLDQLRLIKSSAEVNLMRRTGKLSAHAVHEAMRCTRPGIFEYQLGAVADYIFRVNGARCEGYRPIIAAGDNIWHIHYYRCESKMRDGELVLMDYAPDLNNYTSDIGRMWPVNGTYSVLQRELYGFVVEYHKTLLGCIRPRVSAQEILNKAADMMRPRVEAGFSKPIYQDAAYRMLAFSGHLSHPVGMAVHDVGNYRTQPLQPGLVFSVDPQFWSPEEKLYVRVEDTVVVTDTGVEVLTADAPLDLDAVEAAMREPGMLERYSALEEL